LMARKYGCLKSGCGVVFLADVSERFRVAL